MEKKASTSIWRNLFLNLILGPLCNIPLAWERCPVDGKFYLTIFTSLYLGGRHWQIEHISLESSTTGEPHPWHIWNWIRVFSIFWARNPKNIPVPDLIFSMRSRCCFSPSHAYVILWMAVSCFSGLIFSMNWGYRWSIKWSSECTAFLRFSFVVETLISGLGVSFIFIKICQNTPQLCWGDEWPPLSPGACLREAASAKAGERVRVRGKWSNHHPHLNPPPSPP